MADVQLIVCSRFNFNNKKGEKVTSDVKFAFGDWRMEMHLFLET
jgi:hypothetical protein